jgi:rhodanese-related sulfurtransferase
MASSLGAFQFDNLVHGRIPFLFINLGVDVGTAYPHVFKMHLERTLLTLAEKDVTIASNEEIVAGIHAMKYPINMAIVVVDQNATKAEVVAEYLENAGFTNAFFLRGGWEQLLVEKANGF